MFWTIVYDPLLTALKDIQLGYRLSTRSVPSVQLSSSIPLAPFEVLDIAGPLAIPAELLVNHVAFFDDLNLIANSRDEISQLLIPVESFMNLHNITINPSKTILAYRQDTPQAPLLVSGRPVGTTLQSGESIFPHIRRFVVDTLSPS